MPPARGGCIRVSTSAKDLLTKNIGLYFLFSYSLNRVALTKTFEIGWLVVAYSPLSHS